MATRKRIVRAVLHEIVVRVENGFVDMVLHWRGGDHTALKVTRSASTAGRSPKRPRSWFVNSRV